MPTRTIAIAALIVAVVPCAASRPQPAAASGAVVSPVDRAAIERLLADYNQALSSCASTRYADLFTPDGTFTSNDFRGARHRERYGKTASLVGHDKLVELVDTEEFCLNPEQRAARIAAAARGRNSTSFANLSLESAVDGVRGVLPLGNGGRYEDVYVKTANGWKFKSRKVVMPAPADR
jgi:SnoaL-like protein